MGYLVQNRYVVLSEAKTLESVNLRYNISLFLLTSSLDCSIISILNLCRNTGGIQITVKFHYLGCNILAFFEYKLLTMVFRRKKMLGDDNVCLMFYFDFIESVK